MVSRRCSILTLYFRKGNTTHAHARTPHASDALNQLALKFGRHLRQIPLYLAKNSPSQSCSSSQSLQAPSPEAKMSCSRRSKSGNSTIPMSLILPMQVPHTKSISRSIPEVQSKLRRTAIGTPEPDCRGSAFGGTNTRCVAGASLQYRSGTLTGTVASTPCAPQDEHSIAAGAHVELRHGGFETTARSPRRQTASGLWREPDSSTSRARKHWSLSRPRHSSRLRTKCSRTTAGVAELPASRSKSALLSVTNPRLDILDPKPQPPPTRKFVW